MDTNQKKVANHFKKMNWKYWKPVNQALAFMEELGEYARVLNRIWGPKKKKDTETLKNLKEELGDLYYSLICSANKAKIDLSEALEASIAKKEGRDKGRF